ncbi:MAG: hypothetical protein L0387_05730 [Acidobacteria bacterium]|nr:hypothetical protein [Acidobacteriota bacterium]MCI0722949.1 hypothetical protein [Acidobacteriota bacterium]
MFNYTETLQAMKRERALMLQELDKLDQAIVALQAVAGNTARAKAKPTSSVQSRHQISRTQMAKVKQAKNTNGKKADKTRPKISAQGLRNIVEAQKKRWAKVRAAKAKARPASGKKVSQPPATQ